MQLLILGTSNSIWKDGWVAGLRAALPDAAITNLSIGASPGIQFGLNMIADMTRFDAVFFDSVVNDENQAVYLGADTFVNRIMFEIISTISAQAPAIVLGFSNAVHRHRHSAVYTQRKAMAAMCGAQFIGIHELIETFGTALLPDGSALYDPDGNHPHGQVQAYFGFLLGRFLAQAGSMLHAAPQAVNFSGNFSAETATKLAGSGGIITKSSALTARAVLELRAGASLGFRAAGTCLGVTIDANATTALIALDGPGRHSIKDFWYENKTDGLEVKFVPIRNGFPARRVRVLTADEIPAKQGGIEPSPHTRQRGAFTDGDIKLSFADALFWSGRPEDPLPEPAPEQSLALHRGLEAVIAESLSRPGAPPVVRSTPPA